MNIAFLGAPGAGKGTQAARLAESMGAAYIETGLLLREAVAQKTAVGELARPYMESGRLVPDDIVIGVVQEKLGEFGPSRRGMVLDGFPRTVEQAEVLDELLARRGERLDTVICLSVPREELVRRLGTRLVCPVCGTTAGQPHDQAGPERCPKCGGYMLPRMNDDVEVVARRIETYLAKTHPLLEHYRRKGLLWEVDGHRSIEEIREDIARLVKGVEGRSR